MSDPIIPTPQDAQLLLQDIVTKTASYMTPALDLGQGFAPGGVGLPAAAVVQISALDMTDGNETYALVLQDSPDNVSFGAAGAAFAVGAAGTVAVRGFVRGRFVRLSLTLGGTTPSVTFKAWLNPLP